MAEQFSLPIDTNFTTIDHCAPTLCTFCEHYANDWSRLGQAKYDTRANDVCRIGISNTRAPLTASLSKGCCMASQGAVKAFLNETFAPFGQSAR